MENLAQNQKIDNRLKYGKPSTKPEDLQQIQIWKPSTKPED